MKVVLSPWFYGSCVRYFKQPKVYQPDDLKLLYQKLQQGEPKKVIYVQDSLLQHQQLSKLYAQNRLDEYLSMYKSLLLDVLQKFQPCQTLLELQFNYIVQLLYNINTCISSRQFTKAFQLCFTAQSIFTQKRLTLPKSESLAFEAQFYNLYASVYYKQGKAEAALTFAQQAWDADKQLLPTESLDGQISSLLNVTFLLQHLYRASEAREIIKKALLNVDESHGTQFSFLFEPKLNKQRIGIAKAISMHLNGIIQILSKDSQTPTSVWYQPFDLTLQIAIQYFARLDDIDNCWNNQIIAWALIDLEIVEQLAKKNDPYFVGSLQMGRYENIKYYLFQGETDKNQFTANKYNKESEFLDEMANKKARGLTKLKSTASTRSLSRKLQNKKGGKQGVVKKKKQVMVKNYQVAILPRSKSVQLLHHYNQHYTQNNTEQLSQKHFFDNMGDVRLKYDKANRIPQVLKQKLGIKKTPLQRSYSPILRSDCVPKSITTISFLINFKYESLVDPFPMCLYDLNDVMRYHSTKKNAKDRLPIDYQDQFSLFPNLRYFQGAVKLDPSKYSSAQLETLAATKIQTCFRNILQQRKQMINNTNQANLTVLGYCIGFLTRNKIRKQRQAIYTIQSYIRIYYAVQLKNKSRESVLLIQRLSRGNFIREQFLNYLYYIYRIQRIFKFLITKRRYEQIKVAALSIQRNYNAYKVRKQHKLELKDQLIIIQRIVRVIQAQHKFEEKKNALLLLQKQLRMFKQRSQYMAIYEATVFIQSMYLMLQAHNTYKQKRHSAITIQCFVKYKNLYIQKKRAKSAAITIQIFAKYYIKKQSIYKIYPRHYLELIKSYVKYQIERNYHKRLVQNTIIMQQYIRMFLARLYYTRKLSNLMTIQKYCRKEIQILQCKDARYNRKNKALLIAQNKALQQTPQIQELLNHKIRQAQLNYTMAVNVKPKLFSLQKNKYLNYNSHFRPPVTCFPFKADEVPLYQCAEYYEPAGASFVVRRAIPENPFCQKLNEIDISKRYEAVRPRRLFQKLRKPITYVRVDAKFHSCTDLHSLARNQLRLEEMGIAMIRENIVRRGLASEQQCNEVQKLLEWEVQGVQFMQQVTDSEKDGVSQTVMQELTINPFKFKIRCLAFNYEYKLRDRLHIGRYVILIQKYGRMCLARKKFLDLRGKTIAIQKISRLISVQTRIEEWKGAVDVIQYFYRTNLITAIKNRELQCYSLAPNLRRILKIQKQIRHYQDSTYLSKMIESAITLQVQIRLYIVRQNQKKLLNGVLALQKMLHPITNRIRYQNNIENIKIIQKRFRKCKESIIEKRIKYLQYHYKITNNKPFNYIKETTELQRCLRGVMVQKQLNDEFCAVMYIQTFLKGRKQYLIKETKIQTVLMIQRLYRQNMKSEVQKFRLQVQKIQAVARAHLVNLQWKQELQAGLIIQAYFRGAKQYRDARKIYVAVRRIQLHTRKIQARMQIRKSFEAVVVIQKYFRGVSKRLELLDYIQKLTILQQKLQQTRYNSYWRRKVRYTMQTRQQQIAATLSIQAFISGRNKRFQLKTELLAITIIQRQAHIFIWRCRFFYVKVAAQTIQRRYKERRYRLPSKMLEAQQLLGKEKRAATIIQRLWRGYNVRKQTQEKLEKINLLQIYLSGFLAKIWQRKKTNAVLHIQRCFRRKQFDLYGGYMINKQAGFIKGNLDASQSYQASLKAFAQQNGIKMSPSAISSKAFGSFIVISTVFIQKQIRGFLERKRIIIAIKNVIQIQSIFRGIETRQMIKEIKAKPIATQNEIIKSRLSRLKSRQEQKGKQVD